MLPDQRLVQRAVGDLFVYGVLVGVGARDLEEVVQGELALAVVVEALEGEPEVLVLVDVPLVQARRDELGEAWRDGRGVIRCVKDGEKKKKKANLSSLRRGSEGTPCC